MEELNKLSAPQREAVEYLDTNLIVSSGAGSGKTRMLTYKVAYLINKGYDPTRILAITFTNKAANEVIDRVCKITGLKKREFPWVKTFHSACFKIIKNHAELFGFKKPIAVHTPNYQIRDMMIALTHYGLEKDGIRSTADTMIGVVSNAKNNGNIKEYLSNINISGYDSDQIFEIYNLYNNVLRSQNAVDFDDILLMTMQGFMAKPELQEQYKRLFQYIAVDEHQDSNNVQNEILKLLCNGNNLTVVGDSAQSIYGFRGANPSHFIDFEKTFSPAKLIKLEQNYRSTKQIVEASNCIIDNNTNEIKKKCFSFKNGENITFRQFQISEQEAEWVSQKTLDYITKGYKPEDIAVLYRTKAMSMIMEQKFRLKNIPYVTLGSIGFYDRREVADLNSYLFSIYNELDDAAFERAINIPKRGISEKTIDKIRKSTSEKISLQQKCKKIIEQGNIKKEVSKTSFDKLRELMILLDENRKSTPKEAIENVVEKIKYIDYITETEKDDKMRLKRKINIEELIEVVSMYETVEEFFEGMSLIREDNDDPTEDKNVVRLLTVHACVEPSTLVDTDEGTFQIENINDSGNIATPCNGLQQYDNKFKKKHGDIYNIITKGGYEIGISPEHGMTIWENGEHIRRDGKNLKNGDLLRVKLGGMDNITTEIVLPPTDIGYCNEILNSVPPTLNIHLAELLGILVADGTIRESGFIITKMYESMIKRIQYLCNELFNKIPSYRHEHGPMGGKYIVEFNSTQISRWLINNFNGLLPHKKDIPQKILCSPLNIQAAFIKGIVEDGSVVIKKGVLDHIRFDSSIKKISKTVQYLLLKQGIISSLKTNNYNNHVMHILYIFGKHAELFKEKIGCVTYEKQCLLDSGVIRLKDETNYIPITKNECKKIGSSNFNTIYDYYNARLRGKISRYVAGTILVNNIDCDIRKELESRLEWNYVDIKSIKKSKNISYCVSVPNGERFLQNGFDGWNSKGLEWKVVFFVGVNDGMIPHKFSLLEAIEQNSNEPIEEERRCMYVGMTRAAEKLYLTCSKLHNTREYESSRFIKELPSDYLIKEVDNNYGIGYRNIGNTAYKKRLW